MLENEQTRGIVDSQSHADTEYGDLSCKMADGISADAGIGGGMTGAGADDELSRLLLDQCVQRNLVISEDVDYGTLEDKVLVYVPREGVVVVDEDEVRGGRNGRRGLRLVGGVVDDI